MAKIISTRKIPQVAIDIISSEHEVKYHEAAEPMSRAESLKFIAGADAIISMLSDKVDNEFMDAAGRQLKGVANFAVGYNNIDLQAAKKRNIAIGNTPDVLTDATADIALGLILAASRNFKEATDQVRELGWKDWDPVGLLGVDLVGKTLGIIGLGRIGEAVAKRCHFGWQMPVIYTARSRKIEAEEILSAKRVEQDELFQNADIISLHVDLNDQTKHLINAQALKKMRSKTVLVNTSRGGVIDQNALYEALKNEQIFAAGLDVTDPEPLPADSPLRELHNCFILPHIGSATRDTRDAMARMAAANVLAAVNGEPMPTAVKV